MVQDSTNHSIPEDDNLEERSVLEMDSSQARDFFMNPDSYCTIELPEYFRFGKILSDVSDILKQEPLTGSDKKPDQCEGVNYSLLSNKDGRHAWRPLQLIHPALYVSLVNHMTSQEQWEVICERFKRFSELSQIACLSIPVRSLSAQRKDKAAQILQWWQGIEQKSIELALEYEHVFHADITDCYSSIYTHSIAWALHDKEEAKRRRRESSLIGNVIDKHIRDMRYGQTNGIPQGSVLMDFIAEMVLGYADLQLSEKLQQAGTTDYEILRYRDDYRVFVNNPQGGEAILKALTEVLIDLGLKLNASKTTAAQSVIRNSLKPDKYAWLRARQYDRNLQKHLLLIHAHAIDHPNAGSLVVALTYYLRRLGQVKRHHNPHVLISIAVDIACNNPRTFPVCAAIVSHLLSSIETKDERDRILQAIHTKMSKFPNTGLMEVWLQRIGHLRGFHPDYAEKLCHLVMEKETTLWNNDWITNKALKDALNPAIIVDKSTLTSMECEVSPSEVEIFASRRY